jgi:hypothetical protein
MHYRMEFWRSVLNEIEASNTGAIFGYGSYFRGRWWSDYGCSRGFIDAPLCRKFEYDSGDGHDYVDALGLVLVVSLEKKPNFSRSKIQKAASERFRVARSPCCS